MTLGYDRFASPIGELTVAASARGIAHILFPRDRQQPSGRDTWRHAPALVRDAREQLLAFLQGERTTFDLALDPQGTPFQQQVWDALRTIPFGQTWSYLQLAKAIGRPSASRAVGAANGRNPVPIVVPCHRVIGANGRLTGFSGGLDTKAALLALEQKQATLFGGR